MGGRNNSPLNYSASDPVVMVPSPAAAMVLPHAEGSDMELLSVQDVARLMKLCGRQIYKLSASGRFPAPVKLGRSTRWRADEIQTFIENGCKLPETAGGVQR